MECVGNLELERGGVRHGIGSASEEKAVLIELFLFQTEVWEFSYKEPKVLTAEDTGFFRLLGLWRKRHWMSQPRGQTNHCGKKRSRLPKRNMELSMFMCKCASVCVHA